MQIGLNEIDLGQSIYSNTVICVRHRTSRAVREGRWRVTKAQAGPSPAQVHLSSRAGSDKVSWKSQKGRLRIPVAGNSPTQEQQEMGQRQNRGKGCSFGVTLVHPGGSARDMAGAGCTSDTARVHPGARNRTAWTYRGGQTRARMEIKQICRAHGQRGGEGSQVRLVRKTKIHSHIYCTDTVTANSLEGRNATNRPQPICFSSSLLVSGLRTSQSPLQFLYPAWCS